MYSDNYPERRQPQKSIFRRLVSNLKEFGSFKKPVVSRKDGLPLEGGTMTVSPDGNTTTSTLSFTPTSLDHGLTLSCRASNQMVPHSEMRDTWMLRVFYPPKVTLTLGHGLNANDIKEGADVYFECHLVANPWYHYLMLSSYTVDLSLKIVFILLTVDKSTKKKHFEKKSVE
ncbi:hypothetical protein FQA39_LY08889 [Lamprigera yunnana]|nr:hypothetical protein FQA39_LY08889 [Lamprigera yunnana]